MVILYKPFAIARTVFYAAILSFFLLSGPAFAQNELYTVEGVEVDATASNALEAKDKAFGEAQIKAYEILSQRMVDETDVKAVATPDLSVISSMINDFEVTKEELSSVQYLGTYTFRFNERAVGRHFSVQGVQYTDVGSKPVLMLPFYQTGERSVLWSHGNKWMQAWNRAQNLRGAVPVVLPLGDLDDVSDIGDDEALSYRAGGLSKILDRYQATEAVIAIAVPDQRMVSSLNAGGQGLAGSISVHLYRTDRSRPEYVKEITVTAKLSQTINSLLEEAVNKVNAELQRDWKVKTMVRPNQQNRMQVKVSFATMDEWIRTQRALKRVSGVNEVLLKSLSSKTALVDIIFEGTEQRLRLALEQSNMTLAVPRVDVSSMRYNPGRRIQPMVHELYLNSNRPAPVAPGYSQRF